jgi:hypothetical protein
MVDEAFGQLTLARCSGHKSRAVPLAAFKRISFLTSQQVPARGPLQRGEERPLAHHRGGGVRQGDRAPKARQAGRQRRPRLSRAPERRDGDVEERQGQVADKPEQAVAAGFWVQGRLRPHQQAKSGDEGEPLGCGRNNSISS